MSQFRGYTCDGCQAVIKDGERTRYTEKFDGPVLTGEVVKDLCPTCTQAKAPENTAEVRPLRRRKTAKRPKTAEHREPVAV